jgi:hypothetical protein
MIVVILFGTQKTFIYGRPLCVLQQGGPLSLFWRFFGADGLAPLLHA